METIQNRVEDNHEYIKQRKTVSLEDIKIRLLNDIDIANFVYENQMTNESISKSISTFSEYVGARDGINNMCEPNYYPTLKMHCGLPVIIYSKTQESIESSLKAENDYKTIDVLERESIIPAYKKDELFRVGFANFYAKTKLEKEVLEKSENLAKDYIAREKFNAILIGTPGCGKTHLAMSILRNVNQVMKDKRSLFVNIPELNRLIKMSRAKGNWVKEGELHDLIVSADFLVLDDIGAEKSTESNQEFLYTIIEGSRNIIATTNNLNGYDSRIISRLGYGGKERSINFNGISDKRIT